MKTPSNSIIGVCVLAVLSTLNACAAVRYVDANSASPTPPYTNWATATRVIQEAVDAAAGGDEIVVTNGTYGTGGRAVYGTMTNRVAVDKPLTLRSVNGPQFTIIQGWQVPGITNGDGAIRCVYLTNGATLSGFTLTNGATRTEGDDREASGAGLWCDSATSVVSNCVVTGNSAAGEGGGAAHATMMNCVLTGNSARDGGGAFGTLNNCTLTGNSASAGSRPGAGYSDGTGGGAAHATMMNCVLTRNSAPLGGGAYGGTLSNSVLSSNSAETGGGALSSTLNNCTLIDNSASISGGGALSSTLNNCTLIDNSASISGGGASGCDLNNSIVYFNTAAQGANYDGCNLNYCCATPLPPDGTGNIAVDPQLASASHLSSASPCRGAGSAAYASGMDIDGEAWARPPSIGCDEYHAGTLTGPLSVSVIAALTSVVPDYPLALSALIDGRTTASEWEFGDGLSATNALNTTHVWTGPGDYSVVLRAYNESLPAGISATVTVHVVPQPIHYVAADSINPVAPYTSWATAAMNIQDAVDAATVAGALVLVTNGTYATGGRAVVGTITNRVAVDKPLTLRSVNGPQFTVIQGNQVTGTITGDGAIRCVYLLSGASLYGFTLTNGATRTAGYIAEQSGGAVWCELGTVMVSNCVVAGNAAHSSGGGASGGTLYDCTLNNNSAGGNGNQSSNSDGKGGGAYGGTLNQCTLTGNSVHGSSGQGGGAYGSKLNNCTLTSNSTTYVGGGASESDLNKCMLTSNSAHGLDAYGGGTSGGTLNNCTLISNSACGFGGEGGGAFRGTLNNCTLIANSTCGRGGGAYGSKLNNCTLTGNSAIGGGGVSGCTLNNCITYFNSADNQPNYDLASLNYCCTAPQPTNGVGNFVNAPLFLDYAGGNLRLQPNSPCINAGNNAFAPVGPDLDDNPRVVSGTVDIGAYEFQGVGSVLSYAWLQQYVLPTDGSADFSDPDGDGLNNWQEWRCGTDPTNALSALRLLSPSTTSTNVTVSWQSVAGVSYFLERTTNLALPPAFRPLAGNIPGQPGTTTYTDTNAVGTGPFFYRVGVGN